MHIITAAFFAIFVASASSCAINRTRTVTPTAPPSQLKVPKGFSASIIARIQGPRELTFLPSGDLIVGTSSLSVYIVPNADSSNVGTPSVYATFVPATESSTNGVVYANGYIYVGTQYSVWRIPDKSCALTGIPSKIASVRQGPVAPNSDGDVHTTTSVGVSGTSLLVSVGSSCNACPEVDPTRATIQTMNLNGKNMKTLARRWRNAIAVATDPQSGLLWAGGAGQDNLPSGHPYEFMDHVSNRPLGSDYGWPDCEENHKAYTSGANCSGVVVPTLIFPAYSTIIGAAFYSVSTAKRAFQFPASYIKGLFVSLHGSWHRNANNSYAAPPHVAFVPFDQSKHLPLKAVSWTNPFFQWTDFLTGLQDTAGENRFGRPTGVAVGPQGSLFVADDQNGFIYRIRPS
jgi:glucose/arabinose dehydrogenase